MVNGTTPTNGRVQISLDGQVGSICGFSYFSDPAADVLCRQLNYTGGRKLRNGIFGAGEGKFYLNGIRCQGNESSITQCPMLIEKIGEVRASEVVSVGMASQFRGRGIWYRNYKRSSCWMHQDDAAVQCYNTGLSSVYIM